MSQCAYPLFTDHRLRWKLRPKNGTKGRIQMGRKRRVFTDKFKAKVAIGGGQGGKDIGRVGIGISGASESDIRLEEAVASERAGDIFWNRDGRAKSEEELTAPLYEKIGRLKMDVVWLKKKL
jgi:hypothetical protein